MYFVGLDIGTTGCKAVVFDENGIPYGKSYEEFDIICEKPLWAEQDPIKVLRIAKLVIADAVAKAKKCGMKKEEVVALSTSILGEVIMPVDRDYKPLRNAILGMDYRATEETDLLTSRIAETEIYDITGFVPHPMASLPTIMWMRRNQPELLDRTYKYISFTEYVMKEFGAEEGVIDLPMAGRFMGFDIEKQDWSDKLLAAADMDRSFLCKAVKSGTIVGTLCKTVAVELGLTDKVVLVAGGQDQTCSALGAGLIDESLGLDSHGTIEGVGVMSNHKITNTAALQGGLSCYAYTIPGKYFLMASSQVGGLLLKWFKNNFSYEEVLEARRRELNVYDVMTEHAPPGPSKVMVLPHFIGSGPPWNDLSSRGAIVGLTIDSTRHDVVKAIMDSLTYEFKINMLNLESMGFDFKEIRVVGGASKSPSWMQLKANILNREVSTLREKDAACLGAAIIAMAGIGVYGSAEEAVKNCVVRDKIYEPEATWIEAYQGAFQKYTHLYDALKDFNRIKI